MNEPRNAPASPDLSQPELTVHAPAKPGLAARLLRAISGTTGAYRPSRRGSFLVLVVGTLALMSVFAVVYISIGRADTGAAVGVQRNAARDNVPQQVADHIRKVIGDDTFSRMLDGEDPMPSPPTDPFTRREASDTPGVHPLDTIATFNPVGNGTDPWLSSTVPSVLNYSANGGDEYMQYKDWLNLSVFAPDGAPVNLFNLRGNFEATSQQMRQGLTLISAIGTPGTSSTDYNETVPPYSQGSKPYHYWTRQRGLLRPTTYTGGAAAPPGSPNYMPYQYGSADGSGMYDSRIFELTEARTTNPADNRNLLDAPSKFRYFISAKAIDLSALVNVSTATDFFNGPTVDSPIGLTPSDVDLRRIFTFADPLRQVAPGVQGRWTKTPDPTFGGFLQPDDLVPPPANALKLPYYYEDFNDLVSGTPGAGLVGQWAYDALQQALTEGYVPKGTAVGPGGTTGFTFADGKARSDFYTRFAGYDSSVIRGVDPFKPNEYKVGALFSAEDLLDLFAFRAWNNPEIRSTLERTVGGRFDDGSGTGSYSIMRDNRPPSVEREVSGLIDPQNNASDPVTRAAMLAHYANPRLYLTTISGARPLRSSIIGALTPGVADQLSTAELKVSLDAGPTKTFAVYADALIPHSDQVGTWFGEPQHNNYRAENYAHVTAELGLQMAANMAVNLEQMIKWDGKPRAFTVLVHEDFRTALENDWASTGPGTGKLPKRIAQRQYKSSWWVESSNTTGQLDLGQPDPAKKAQSRLAHEATSRPVAAAFNVFGVHAEPVLTSVATFILYADAPTFSNDATILGGAPSPGSADVDGQGDPSVPGQNGELVTVRGTVEKSNADFIVQIVAFQLTNPYDISINLTPSIALAANTATSAPYDYYFEFGERYYRVGEVVRNDWISNPGGNDNPLGALGPVTMAPGETRVFFATNVSLETAAKRLWNAAIGPTDGTPDYPTWREARVALDKWIKFQLASNPTTGHPSGAPVWIEPFSITDRNTTTAGLTNIKRGLRAPYDNNTTFFNMFDTAVANPASIRTVRLWRSLRSEKGPIKNQFYESPDPTKPGDPLPEQFLENDMLVDRLRDAATASTLDCTIANTNGQNDRIENARGFDEQWSTPGEGYNTGLGLFRYGLVERKADPAGANLPVGAVPAYMLETRYGIVLNDRTFKISANNPLNRAFIDGGGREKNHTANRNVSADARLINLMGALTSSGLGGQPNSYVLPWGRAGGRNGAFRDAPYLWGEAPYTGGPILTDPPPITNYRPQLPGKFATAAGAGTPHLRIGDALLPLAVGPVQLIFDPALNGPTTPKPTDPSNPVLDRTYIDSTYLTSGEMLAMSIGWDRFYTTTSSTVSTHFKPLYADFFNISNAVPLNGASVAKTDRGQLVLDRFVPFYDAGGTAVPAPATFDPVSGDYRRGLGIPAALAVLDGFISPEMAKYGSLSRAIPGLVNAGTAPAPVWRTLPLISPTPDAADRVWMSGLGFTPNSDIGATIVGYRDKVEVPFRAGSVTVGPGAEPTADFLDSTGIKPNDLQRIDGRDRVTYVEGVREQPGIRTIGEIGLARTIPSAGGDNYAKPNSIDFPGYTSGAASAFHMKGLDSVVYGSSGPTPEVSSVPQSYSQKLAVLTAISNTVTNRSDLFAVWFVINGYQRSDVENLNASDPMVPSVQRRFFMVIDRSEVVKQGQKPRIVLMRELPM